jgi:hypothetical protein
MLAWYEGFIELYLQILPAMEFAFIASVDGDACVSKAFKRSYSSETFVHPERRDVDVWSIKVGGSGCG